MREKGTKYEGKRVRKFQRSPVFKGRIVGFLKKTPFL
jgi:hypothetical protein